jgi:hypothetical protein
MAETLQVGIAITQLYSLTHFFLKLSILQQYARIGVLPSGKRLCHIMIAILCTGYLIFIVLRMVRCIPFHTQWTPKLPGARCIYNNTWFMFASQGWNMAMDFVILLSPLYILRHSNAPLKRGCSSASCWPCSHAMKPEDACLRWSVYPFLYLTEHVLASPSEAFCPPFRVLFIRVERGERGVGKTIERILLSLIPRC